MFDFNVLTDSFERSPAYDAAATREVLLLLMREMSGVV